MWPVLNVLAFMHLTWYFVNIEVILALIKSILISSRYDYSSLMWVDKDFQHFMLSSLLSHEAFSVLVIRNRTSGYALNIFMIRPNTVRIILVIDLAGLGSAERKETKFLAFVLTLEILSGPTTAIIDQIRMFSGLFFRVDFKFCLKFVIPVL